MKILINNIKTQNKTLNIGFVGLGWIGLNRMQALLSLPDIKGAAILEPNKENAEKALEIAHEAEVYNSYDELLNDPEIDAVVIATPSALHAEQAIQALEAKKAVFCQKPLGRNLKEVEKVIKAAQENNQLLGVDLSYRYTKAFQKIYKAIQQQEIGEIYAAELVFHNAYGPDKEWFYDYQKAGGGCVLDLGLHLVDLVLWSLNYPEVQNLKSHLFNQGEKIMENEEVVEDFASVMCSTEYQTSIHLQCSWNISAGRDAVIAAKFFGTKGGLAFKNINGSFYDFVAEKYIGTQTEKLVSPPDDWGGKAIKNWAESLQKGKKFDAEAAKEQIKLAKVLDRIYGRQH